MQVQQSRFLDKLEMTVRRDGVCAEWSLAVLRCSCRDDGKVRVRRDELHSSLSLALLGATAGMTVMSRPPTVRRWLRGIRPIRRRGRLGCARERIHAAPIAHAPNVSSCVGPAHAGILGNDPCVQRREDPFGFARRRCQGRLLRPVRSGYIGFAAPSPPL